MLVMSPQELVKPWRPGRFKRYLLRNASIIDPLDGSIHRRDVGINEGTIMLVDEVQEDRWVFDDDHVIVLDLTGKYLCPGLIDCHVHIAAVPAARDLGKIWGLVDSDTSKYRHAWVLKAALERGFTTLRDNGGANLALKQAVEEGVFPGPRLFIAGKALSQTGGHGDMRSALDPGQYPYYTPSSLSRICDGPEECLRAARDELRQGADFIKIMAGGGVSSPTDKLEHLQFTPPEIQAIVTAASNVGKMVTAQAYTPAAIRLAIDNGCKGIEHGNLLDQATATYMAEKDVFLTPTLITYSEMTTTKGFLSPESKAKNDAVLEAGLTSLKIAAEAGVTMCYGTDLFGPLTAAETREFTLRANALCSLQILQSATINAARMLGQGDRFGRIAEGLSADLLILNANPLEDISVLDSPSKHLLAVMKGGRMCVSRWSKVATETPAPIQNIE